MNFLNMWLLYNVSQEQCKESEVFFKESRVGDLEIKKLNIPLQLHHSTYSMSKGLISHQIFSRLYKFYLES